MTFATKLFDIEADFQAKNNKKDQSFWEQMNTNKSLETDARVFLEKKLIFADCKWARRLTSFSRFIIKPKVVKYSSSPKSANDFHLFPSWNELLAEISSTFRSSVPKCLWRTKKPNEFLTIRLRFDNDIGLWSIFLFGFRRIRKQNKCCRKTKWFALAPGDRHTRQTLFTSPRLHMILNFYQLAATKLKS